MIERIAQAANERERREFDRIRFEFVREASRHMDHGQGIAAVERDPDNYFWFLWEQMMLAAHAGRPVPHAWFAEFCHRMLTHDLPDASSLN